MTSNSIHINTSNVTERAVLPAGTYDGVIEKAEIKTSNNGDDYLNLSIKIHENSEFDGLWAYKALYFHTDAALGFSFRMIQTILGRPLPKGEMDIEPDDFLDQPVRFVVKQGTNPNTGEPRADISGFLPPLTGPNSGAQAASASIAAGKAGRGRVGG